MRKINTIRSLLHSADEKALEKIAASCPAAGKRTKKRLFKRLMQKIAAPPESTEEGISVTYEVGVQQHSWRHIALSVTACAVMLAVTGTIFLLQKPERETPLQLAMETTTPDEPETAFMEIEAGRPAETDPEIVTGIGIDLPVETVAETDPAAAETQQLQAPPDEKMNAPSSVQTATPEKASEQHSTNTVPAETAKSAETTRPTETIPSPTESETVCTSPPDPQEDDETNRAAAKKIGENALKKMQSGLYSPGRVLDASEFMDEDMAVIREKQVYTYLCFINEHTVLLRMNKGLLDVWGYLITDGTVTYSEGEHVPVPSHLFFDGDSVRIEWADDRLYYFSAGT